MLAEQTGKSANKADKEQNAGSSTAATTAPADGNAPPPAPATEAPIAPDTQGLVPPVVAADLLQANESGTDDAILETQVQTAAELIQAVLMPGSAGTGSAQPEAAAIPVATAAATTPALVAETISGTDPQGDSVADMRLALARSAHGETPPDNSDVPAKLAAPNAVFTLPTETRAVPSNELSTARADAGMAQAAASMAATMTTQAAAAALPHHGAEYRIVTPVGTQHWETAIGNSLVIMSGSQQNRAELVLTPPQLGRIEVSISMKGDEATAIFVSANPAVRDALESALPRLREVLSEAGITLGQTQVGAESQGQSASERQNGDNASRRGIADALGSGESPLGAGNPTGTGHRVTSRSLVDTYA